jgi:GrpB-like predicted nucleotidyltransferase (UPF0157 family)
MKIHPPEEYQPAANVVYAEALTVLSALAPDARIEHVGSSAIPGAYSKGDVDICVCVAPAAFVKTLAALLAAGYCIKQDTLRTGELCMLESDAADEPHAVQLIAAGSKFEFFFAFRDALTQDPQLVSRYNALKPTAARLGEADYRREKSRFIDEVLEGAQK